MRQLFLRTKGSVVVGMVERQTFQVLGAMMLLRYKDEKHAGLT